MTTSLERLNSVLRSAPPLPPEEGFTGELSWLRARVGQVRDALICEGVAGEVWVFAAPALFERLWPACTEQPELDAELEPGDPHLSELDNLGDDCFVIEVSTGVRWFDEQLHRSVGFAYPDPRTPSEVQARWVLQVGDSMPARTAAGVASALER